MDNNKIKNFIIIAILVIVVVIGTIFAKNKFSSAKNTSSNSAVTVAETNTPSSNTNSNIQQRATDIILFYGDTCPHCKVVEEYINKNNITRYIKFQNLEVFNNQDNAKLMTEKQDLCKDLSADDKGGVPFLYSSEKCVVGDQPVIDFLKAKAGI